MTAPVRFTVRMPRPHTHLFEVRMEIMGTAERAHLDLHMPVWTPGSYLVREYARHVQRLVVHDEEGRRCPVRKTDKATWRVDCGGARALTVDYEVYSHELAVRTNHLDDSHGFYNGPALYLYATDLLATPVEVRLEPPEGWDVFCGLEAIDAAHYLYRAPDYETLLDTPVEMGPHRAIEFEILGVPHRYVFWGGPSNLVDEARLIEDTRRIVMANADVFGGQLPYEDGYIFIVHLTDEGRGGLEHHNSTVLLWPRMGFVQEGVAGAKTKDPQEPYLDFLRLVAHEHFHVWNVKRLRPQVFHGYDLQSENYTGELWTVEGITSYYELRALLRAGILDGERFLKIVADTIRALEQVPGRRVHSLEEASFDAWIKLYRPDENTLNSSVSYYLKGELAALILDLQIREHSAGERSLDDVLHHAWQHHYLSTTAGAVGGESAALGGYEEGAYEGMVAEVTGLKAADFFERTIRGTDELDWEEALGAVGLALERGHEHGAPPAWLGVHAAAGDGGRAVVRRVPTDSCAQRGGIYAGDELVALNGHQLVAHGLDVMVQRYRPGDTVGVHLFRRGLLHQRQVTLQEKPQDQYKICRVEAPEESQLALLEGWLGTRLAPPQDGAEETP